MLVGAVTYKSGRGVRGRGTWAPVAAIVDALDAAFYASFRTVEPRGKRDAARARRVGLDGERHGGGVPGLSPRVASAAMALVTAATEREHAFVGVRRTQLEPS